MTLLGDDADSLKIFAQSLRIEGASINATVRGSKNLTMLAKGKYDVPRLSDIEISEMSGPEFRTPALMHVKKPFHSIVISNCERDVDVHKTLPPALTLISQSRFPWNLAGPHGAFPIVVRPPWRN